MAKMHLIQFQPKLKCGSLHCCSCLLTGFGAIVWWGRDKKGEEKQGSGAYPHFSARSDANVQSAHSQEGVLDLTDYLIGKLPDQTKVQVRTRSDQTLRPN